MTPKQKPYCHTCAHCEVPPTGAMICVVTIHTMPTRLQRSEQGLCGVEGKLYETREDEVHDITF